MFLDVRQAKDDSYMNRDSIVKTGQKPVSRGHYPNLSGVKHIVAVGSGKGGVGKSSVSSNLAVALRACGAEVGLMDADIYGPSQPGMLGAEGARPGIKDNQLLPISRHGVRFISMGLLMDGNSPVIWRAPMAMKMIQQFIGSVVWGDLDYLLIDLPPGTGDVQLTLAQQAPLSGALIVTTPQDVSIGVAHKGLKMFQQVNVPILGIIENMSGFTCGHCGEVTAIFKEGGGEKMAADLGVPYLGSIPLDLEIMNCGDEGIPIMKKSPDSPAAKAFLAVAEKFQQHLERESTSGKSVEPIDVEISSNGELIITWPGDHTGIHSPYNLRKNCKCASCVDENTGKRVLDDRRVPLDIRIKSFQPVGRYALAMVFSDRHSTGIYSHQHLLTLCECPECIRKRGDKTDSFIV